MENPYIKEKTKDLISSFQINETIHGNISLGKFHRFADIFKFLTKNF